MVPQSLTWSFGESATRLRDCLDGRALSVLVPPSASSRGRSTGRDVPDSVTSLGGSAAFDDCFEAGKVVAELAVVQQCE
jgi:hypothetical protein